MCKARCRSYGGRGVWSLDSWNRSVHRVRSIMFGMWIWGHGRGPGREAHDEDEDEDDDC